MNVYGYIKHYDQSLYYVVCGVDKSIGTSWLTSSPLGSRFSFDSEAKKLGTLSKF